MRDLRRREFLQATFAATWAGGQLPGWTGVLGELQATEATGQGLQLGRFLFDVTPPIGHSCCGGWIPNISSVDDPSDAVGVVILGAGKPIVLCAVDWTGLLNAAHVEWRTALAEAAGTTPERVAVHCVHQHNAPMACLEAENLVAAQKGLPHIVDVPFFRQCLERGRNAVREAVRTAQPLTHVAAAQGKVEQVASNRRVARDAQGRVTAMRGSACKDEKLRSLPEGMIDPWLKTIAFYHEHKKLAAMHFYATHPMSYYGDGRATSDFVGLARKYRQQAEPDTLQLYFTGCAGNVTAGKYNDGSTAMRGILAQRIQDGMVAADRQLKPEKIERAGWKSIDLLPTARPEYDPDKLLADIANVQNPVVGRNRPAYILSWLRRVQQRVPIVLGSLQLNQTATLHLPGECFIDYQLRGQQLGKEGRFVATAAYGDGGPWYIPVKEEYPAGGYEVSVAFCDPSVDDLLTNGMRQLLS